MTPVEDLVNDGPVKNLRRLSRHEPVVAEVAVLPAAAAEGKNVGRQAESRSDRARRSRRDVNSIEQLPSRHLAPRSAVLDLATTPALARMALGPD